MAARLFMLLFISSAGFRRAVFSSGPLFSDAFLTSAPLSPPSAVALSSAPSVTGAATNYSWHRPLRSLRFMTTDSLAGDKTDEEKAAIKAAREARK